MPIYEYCCESCGHEFEAIQKMSDEPLVACPTCREPALKKRISAAAFRLKGSGWYETDFKTGEKKKNLAKGDAGSTDTNKAESKGKDSANKDNTKTTKKTAAVSSE